MGYDRGLDEPRSLDGLAIDRSRASPNHGPRLGVTAPDLILLHYTGMRDEPAAIDWLCRPESQVSCHYVVREDGGILQLVADDRRAWHAGRSCWAGVTDLNSASIGIEIVNGGHDYGLPPYPDRQMESVIALCRALVTLYRVPPERLLAHSDVAPSRKRDPGEHFSWRRLADAGIGLWAEPDRDDADAAAFGTRSEVEALQRGLARFGYAIDPTGQHDAETACVVRAFQRHFLPVRVDGLADGATRSVLAKLLALCANPQQAEA